MKAIALAVLLFLTGCAFATRATIQTDSPAVLAPGAVQHGKVLEGAVVYFGSCQRAARQALERAWEAARAMGATALYDVRWLYRGEETPIPVCESTLFSDRIAVTATAVSRWEGR